MYVILITQGQGVSNPTPNINKSQNQLVNPEPNYQQISTNPTINLQGTPNINKSFNQLANLKPS